MDEEMERELALMKSMGLPEQFGGRVPKKGTDFFKKKAKFNSDYEF